jgi:hypothetical protein
VTVRSEEARCLQRQLDPALRIQAAHHHGTLTPAGPGKSPAIQGKAMDVCGFDKAACYLLDQLTDLAGDCSDQCRAAEQWCCEPRGEAGPPEDGAVRLLYREDEGQFWWGGSPGRCPAVRVDQIGSAGELEAGSASQGRPESNQLGPPKRGSDGIGGLVLRRGIAASRPYPADRHTFDLPLGSPLAGSHYPDGDAPTD